ncbi:MAG: hypothetical protein GTN65_10245 [Armatimonadetes bacterium]|nr:hypothetical protein [Armatimonadota bacterium]NIM23979.1 hypothetical protein [Armatimonadota bacterium]NIO97452.1 hypothetical protein [Armatimonadota bacterium]
MIDYLLELGVIYFYYAGCFLPCIDERSTWAYFANWFYFSHLGALVVSRHFSSLAKSLPLKTENNEDEDTHNQCENVVPIPTRLRR